MEGGINKPLVHHLLLHSPCLHHRTHPAPSSAQVSAIISPDKAVVLKSSREKENQNIIAPMLKVNGFCVMAATQQPASIWLYCSNILV